MLAQTSPQMLIRRRLEFEPLPVMLDSRMRVGRMKLAATVVVKAEWKGQGLVYCPGMHCDESQTVADGHLFQSLSMSGVAPMAVWRFPAPPLTFCSALAALCYSS